MINFDDFQKVEIKIGKILSAERVEGSLKLLKLEVDFGMISTLATETTPSVSNPDKRQIISGIAEFYKPEDIIGKEAAFVVNLEPRAIMGIESNGMILATRSGEQLAIIGPDKEVLPGSSVK